MLKKAVTKLFLDKYILTVLTNIYLIKTVL